MNNKLIISTLLAVVIFLASCDFFTSSLPNNALPELADEDYMIPHWQVTGPYYTDSIILGRQLFDYPLLKGCGVLSDNEVNEQQLLDLDSSFVDSLFYTTQFVNADYSNQRGYIDFKNFFKADKTGLIFMSCIVESEEEKDVVFMIGSQDGYQISLNGDSLYRHALTIGYVYNQHQVFAHLKKGKNTIVIKIANERRPWMASDYNKVWRFSCNLVSLERYYDFYLPQKNDYLELPVVPKHYPITIRPQFHFNDPILKANLVSRENNELVCSIISSESKNKYLVPENVEEGCYELQLICAQDTFRQTIYYGDFTNGLDALVHNVKQRLTSVNDERVVMNFQTLLDRYHILTDYYNSRWGLKIEGSKDGIYYEPLDTVLTVPSRWLSVPPMSHYKLTSEKKNHTYIAEVDFFLKDSNDSELVSTSYNNEKIWEMAGDNRISSRWQPTSISPYILNFDTDSLPHYIRIISHPSDWSRKLERRSMFLYSELQLMYNNLEKNIDPCKNMPGTHLRAYKSPVEEQAQYYIATAPSDVEEIEKPLPLVVSIAVPMTNFMSFLRSINIAEVNNLDRIQYLSNEMKFVRILAEARIKDRAISTPIAENEIFAAIEAAKANYNIDTTRIYLTAYCGATKLALEFPTHYPSLFSAISLGNSVINNHPKSHFDEMNLPINYTQNLMHTPIFATVEEYDSHSPKESIAKYLEKATLNGVKVTYNINKEGTLESKNVPVIETEMYSFLKDKVKKTPTSIQFSTAQHKYHKSFWLSLFPLNSGVETSISATINHNELNITTSDAGSVIIYPSELPFNDEVPLKVVIDKKAYSYQPPFLSPIILNKRKLELRGKMQKDEHVEGPLMHAFSNRFMLVEGSLGNAEIQKESVRLETAFKTMWKNTYIVDCISKVDSEIDSIDYANSNLLLIGNQHSNKIMQRIYGKIPLIINENSIVLDGKRHIGNNLNYRLIYPNPYNPQKYLILMGGNNLKAVTIESKNPAEYGYHDYEIFTMEEEKKHIIDAGYFDQYWKIVTH